MAHEQDLTPGVADGLRVHSLRQSAILACGKVKEVYDANNGLQLIRHADVGLEPDRQAAREKILTIAIGLLDSEIDKELKIARSHIDAYLIEKATP